MGVPGGGVFEGRYRTTNGPGGSKGFPVDTPEGVAGMIRPYRPRAVVGGSDGRNPWHCFPARCGSAATR